MSKKSFKAQASSSKAFSQGNNAFGAPSSSSGFSTSGFGTASSTLSYLAEQPDLSSISDANLVVQFKNLGKRDSTTKARALEETQNAVVALKESGTEVDESLLAAWVKVYPRTSIDVSRRVRQLSQQVHGQICLQSGKRVAKHMPSIIGAWFAGWHDTDRIVVRAASEAFDLVFPTAEKRAALPKAYHINILEFCRDAILKESPQSLSDERMTSSDDSEAKYSRVISSSISSLCSLMETLSNDEINKQSHAYEELLASEKLWTFLGSKDLGVRRATFKLLRTGLQKHKTLLTNHFELICNTIFSDKVLKRQTATALDYVSALRELASVDPILFTLVDKKKQSRTHKFFDFLKRGSQGASENFWKIVNVILNSIPNEALPHDVQQSEVLLSTLRTGINQRDEVRTNAESAWECYIGLLHRLGGFLSSDDQQKLMNDCAIPIIQQYLDPMAERASWTIQGSKSSQIAMKLLQMSNTIPAVELIWPQLAQDLLEAVKTSAPEQSKDFKTSQDSIAMKARKWFALQAQVLLGDFPQSFKDVALQNSILLVSGCIETVKVRDGKPYGAAEAIKDAVTHLKVWLFDDKQFIDNVEELLSTWVPSLISSNSGSSLISLLYECQDLTRFEYFWNAALRAILSCDDNDRKSLLALFLTSPQISASFEAPLKSQELQSFLKTHTDQSIDGSENWDMLRDIFRAPANVMTNETLDYILSELVSSLTISGTASNALSGLEILSQQEERDKIASDSTITPQLRQNILLLTESEDDALAARATILNEKLMKSSLNGSGTERSKESDIRVIQTGLSQASQSSLSVDTLVELASQQVRAEKELDNELAQAILPSVELWEEYLQSFLEQPVPQSFSSSTELGSAICVVKDAGAKRDPDLDSRFDRIGLSPPLRMCLYTISLLEETALPNSLGKEHFASVFRLLLLTVRLINDKLTMSLSNELWSGEDTALEDLMLDNTSRAGKLFNIWLSRSTNEVYDPNLSLSDHALQILQSKLWESSAGESWISFHHARAYSFVVSQSLELSGWKAKSEQFLETRFKELRQSKDSLLVLAFVSAFKAPLANTKYYLRVCNELVADLTGIELSSTSSTKATNMAVLLGSMLDGQEHVAEAVAKQRLVFLVQHIVPWLKTEDASELLQVQICVVLKHLLPVLNDVYGSFWSSIIDFICSTWNKAQPANQNIGFGARLPLYNATLRLFSLFSSLALDEDANDDLKDSIQESETTALDGMINLLKQLNQVSDSFNQPLQTVNELLGRQIAKMPIGQVENFEELISLVAADSASAQRCAFEILHKQIPKRQEQISVDVALEKRSARLADELLSLVIEGPAVELLSESDFLRTMPLPIRSYLSAWLLIFDNFKGASDKVRNDYTSHLKEENVLPTLLDFIADFLGHSRGKPIDASRFDVTIYSFDIEESPLRDIQWLLTHLYFLSLKRLPALTKNWWMDCKSRQTVVSIESWTEKYISSQLITDALETVSQWANTQDSSSDDAIIVKTSQRAKEITVSKEIDDEVMSMVIRLPDNFPLGEVVLTGINRVAVDEKKWRSWLMNSQGVIKFSNNSLIDGIIAFRRNVVGALKGQTECAICYAIVGSDKQLPTKRCGTCNNLFHGSCLYRWFKSSNSSSCPLCRNPFNYT